MSIARRITGSRNKIGFASAKRPRGRVGRKSASFLGENASDDVRRDMELVGKCVELNVFPMPVVAFRVLPLDCLCSEIGERRKSFLLELTCVVPCFMRLHSAMAVPDRESKVWRAEQGCSLDEFTFASLDKGVVEKFGGGGSISRRSREAGVGEVAERDVMHIGVEARRIAVTNRPDNGPIAITFRERNASERHGGQAQTDAPYVRRERVV